MHINRHHHLFELLLISLIMPWMECNATDGPAKAELTTTPDYNNDQAANRVYEPHCCPRRGWTLFQEPDEKTFLTCVKIFYDWNTTYSEIEERCKNEGGWPASIHGSLQNIIIKRMAVHSTLEPNYVSIGLTNQRPQALQSQDEDIALYASHHHIQDWFWLNQSTVDFTRWQKGYPKVSKQPRCAVMVTKPEGSPSHGFWRDFDCDKLRAPFVCQVQTCRCEEEKGYYC